MEINLNKEEYTKTSIFIDFSIREFVAEIRKTNPVKCWPFGSLRDPDSKLVSSYQSADSTFLSGKKCPPNIIASDDTTELTEAPNYMIESLGVDSDMVKNVYNGSSELTFFKVNNSQTRHEINNVDEGAKIKHNEAVDNNEPQRNRTRRKPHKFRLLFDIYKDPASELRALCDRTNLENVNRRFMAEIEDHEWDDDITLAACFRKQKGVEIADPMLSKKKDMTGVEEPSVDLDKKSNSRIKDSIRDDSNIGSLRKKSRTDDMDTQNMLEHKKDFRLQCRQKTNQFAKDSSKKAREKENEDSEMEAVLLLARHFNEQKQILRDLETNPSCACIKKKTREHPTQAGNKPIIKTSSKTARKRRVKKITNEKLENAFYSVQMMSFMSAKATSDGDFQMSMMKAARVGTNAQNCPTLVCSFNRNPADFNTEW